MVCADSCVWYIVNVYAAETSRVHRVLFAVVSPRACGEPQYWQMETLEVRIVLVNRAVSPVLGVRTFLRLAYKPTHKVLCGYRLVYP